MLLLGEEFIAASRAGMWLTVGGPMQVEGDAPSRFFIVHVHNTGDHAVDVIAEESLNGTTWTRANTQGGVASGIATLAARCEQTFTFLVEGSLNWWRLRSTGLATLSLKVESMQGRAPANV